MKKIHENKKSYFVEYINNSSNQNNYFVEYIKSYLLNLTLLGLLYMRKASPEAWPNLRVKVYSTITQSF